MQTIVQGLQILQIYFLEIVLFLSASLLLGFVVSKPIFRYFKELTWLQAACSAVIGLIVISILFLGVIVFHRLTGTDLKIGGVIICLIAVLILVRMLLHGNKTGTNNLHLVVWVVGVLGFISLLILRLVFLKDLLLPPYADSVEHVLITKDFLSSGQADTAYYSLFNHYYHFGFHALTAWLSAVTGLPVERAIPLVGQLMLVLSPLSVMVLAGVLTRNKWTAIFSAMIAAVVWQMPAFAINWGKYPAVTGLAVFPAAISLVYLTYRSRLSWPLRLVIIISLCFGCILIHSRSVLLLAISLLCYLSIRWFGDSLQGFGNKKWILVAFLTIWGIAVLKLFDKTISHNYFESNWPLISFFIILLLFAGAKNPRLCMALLMAMTTMILLTLLPVPSFLQSYTQTWLDRPFVETAFYIPLSILGGLGVEQVSTLLSKSHFFKQVKIQKSLPFIILFAILFYSLQRIDLFPNACCNYVHPEDIQALSWISSHTPENAMVIISGYPMVDYLMETDAGAWVEIIAKRRTQRLDYSTNLDDGLIHDKLCIYDPSYIYNGHMVYSFDYHNKLDQWYTPVFEEGEVIVYQVDGCD